MRTLIPVICLALLSLSNCIPQRAQFIDPRQVTQTLPHYSKLTPQQIKSLQNRGFAPTIPSRVTAAYREEEEDDDEIEYDSSTASTQVRRPVYAEDNYPIPNAIPIPQRPPQVGIPIVQHRPPPQLTQRRPHGPPQQFKEQLTKEFKDAKEEEEKEEPDRLSILLPQSSFDCTSRKTGYYADEGLGCEVFHYCQDNARHSWICPDGFTFHQVHLICMPPSNENICEKSSDYHFVNEYLYKPLNVQEYQTKPNVTLKYSDRYYPDSYYERDDDDEIEHVGQRKQPIRIGLQQAPSPQQQIAAVLRRPQPQQFSPAPRPVAAIGQVFRSPEEVNISLQQRRPQYVTQRYIPQEEEYK